jgi:predicted RNA-binding Zn-ribbon protein involved in translation (DUF1610 family)
VPNASPGASSSISPPSELAHDDVVVHCEDPKCGEQLVLRASRSRGPPQPPVGNWFCARCSNEARHRGIRLFERVVRTREFELPTGKMATQYLVSYWAHGEEEDEWLGHEQMQRLEISCSGV